MADFNPAFKMTNDSFASKWFQFGSIPARSTVVTSGPTQIGATAASPFSMTYANSVFSKLVGNVVEANTTSVQSAVAEVTIS
ncbi:uncharacterized protein ACA1_267070 [Acanthamoeba castellanii str. Neff]|uniref:Uncharacterized protein n=1 Tax=Acanthamoeba castellanii (strain ATCC 30010 / Neff) TaxID=1257118 RepID=L8H1S0_ACACF|nr:uncharacterized protein ACA1_267070 [Acanthamoeba castellanii str. Neff]ELR19449.1 hypothetical protein ACA1_267070 [Acanthamoeba castellanii str. Neff]